MWWLTTNTVIHEILSPEGANEMNYVIEKTEDGFTLTFAGEEPQFFADIVELEDVVIARLRNEAIQKNGE